MRKKINGIVHDALVDAVQSLVSVLKHAFKWTVRLSAFWLVYKLVFIKCLDQLKEVSEKHLFLVLVGFLVLLIFWIETMRRKG